MKRFFTMLVASALIAGSLSACAVRSDGQYSKESGGALIGGAAGAVAGAQFGGGRGQLAATAIGTLLGAFVGSEVGRSLDKADLMYAGRAQERAYSAPVGQSIQWNNPESGNRGTITTTRDGTASSGEYCREFQQTVTIGGQTETAYGTACRKPDGSWNIVN